MSAQDPSIEISNTTSKVISLKDAIVALTQATAGQVTAQGHLKTSNDAAMSSMRNYMASVDSGFNKLLGAVQRMNQDLNHSFAEMVKKTVRTVKDMGPELEGSMENAGRNSSRSFAKGISEGTSLVRAEVKKQQAAYEAEVMEGQTHTAAKLKQLRTSGVSLLPDDRLFLANQIKTTAEREATLKLAAKNEIANFNAMLDEKFAREQAYQKASKVASVERLAQSTAQASAEASLLASAAQQAALKDRLLAKRSGSFNSVFDDIESQKTSQMEAMYRAQEALQKKALAEREATLKLAAKNEIANFNAMLDEKFAREQAYQKASRLSDRRQVQYATSNPQGEFSELATGKLRGFNSAIAESNKLMPMWTNHANDMHSAARGLASGFGLLWLTWGNMAPLLAGAAISYSFAGVLKTGSEVNHIMESMRILTDQAASATDSLNTQLLELARTGPIGPKAIAEAMKQLSLAGLNRDQISQAIKPTLNLSVVGDIDLKKSADTLTGLGEAFGLTAEHYNYIADVIAKASATSKASVESISEAMRTASVLHKQYGVSMEDMALGVSALNNLNIQGGAAGTALRNMYVDLSGRSSAARRALRELGIDVKDANGHFKGLVTIIYELQKALDTRSSADAQKYLKVLMSERGAKPIVEGLDLAKQESTSGMYRNRLEEMQGKNIDPGYSTLKAAEISTTARKQMESVLSGLQATMVETFSTMEPYILRVSVALKEAFASDSFKFTLQSLITLVGNLTVFMAEHAKAILLVGLSYGALKVIEGVAAAYHRNTLSTIANSAALKLNAEATKQAAAAQALLVAESGMATRANIGGKIAGAFSAALATGNQVLLVIGAVVAAYELYNVAHDALFGVDKNEAMRIKQQEFNKTIQEQADQIDRVNEAKKLGISLDELVMQKKVKETLASTQTLIDEARVNYQNAQKRTGWVKGLTNPSKTAIELLEADEQVKFDKLRKLQEDSNKGLFNVEKIRDENEQKANAARLAMTPKKLSAETGNGGPPTEGMPAHLMQHEAGQVKAVEDAFNRKISLKHKENETLMFLLESQHKHHLVSDEEFNTKKLALSESAFNTETDLILKRQTDLTNLNDGFRRKQLASLGVNLPAGASSEDISNAAGKTLNITSEQFTARYPIAEERRAKKIAYDALYALNEQAKHIQNVADEAVGKQQDSQFRRASEAANELAGSYRKIELELANVNKSMDAYYQHQAGLRAEPKTDPFEKVWDKAGREARVHALAKLQEELAKVDAEIAKHERSIILDSSLDEAALQVKYDSLVRLKQQREEALKTGINKAAQEGTAATQYARQQETTKVIGTISADFSKSITSAVFDGGVNGAQMLEKYLRDMLLRKPFEIMLETSINQLAKGILGTDTLNGIADWTKGIFGKKSGELSFDEMNSKGFDWSFGQSSTAGSMATTAATTTMSASTLFSSAVAAFTSAVAMLGASSASSGAGSFASMFAGNSAGGGWSPTPGEFLPSAGGIPAFASGGQMNPYSLAQVNESGTEMLSVGGRDYLMTGGQNAVITPTSQMTNAGGGINHSVTIHVDSRTDQAQVHSLVMNAVQQGNAQLVDQLQQSGALSR